MSYPTYFHWLVNETPTTWWNDSADPAELDNALTMGISGVTTNPILNARAIRSNPGHWDTAGATKGITDPEERAQRLVSLVVHETAAKLEPIYRHTNGEHGFVCAQVNPSRAGERDPMLKMAQRFHVLAPNIAVKLPVTAAGLDVLEECVALGITVTGTVSFTVPQVLAVAERHRLGSQRAVKNNIIPGKCFAVVMVGRLDDYLREIAADAQSSVLETDIIQAGIAVVKRAYAIFLEQEYRAVLLPAALRGVNQMTELAGARVVMSIHPKVQGLILNGNLPRESRINIPVAEDVLARLNTLPEFVRAYEPGGLKPAEFAAFGLTQRTISSFIETGWLPLETYNA
ncbi:MAG: transaldolase family protein [Anaerolineae bacterium]